MSPNHFSWLVCSEATHTSELTEAQLSHQLHITVIWHPALLVLVYYKGAPFSIRVAHQTIDVKAGCSEPGHEADSLDFCSPEVTGAKHAPTIGPARIIHLHVYTQDIYYIIYLCMYVYTQ